MLTTRHFGRIVSAWGVPVAVALAALAIYAQNASILQTVNHLAYDRFVKLDSQLTVTSANVLLVYADAELDRQPDRYWQLIRQLRHYGATGIGIADLDARGWEPDQLQRLSRWSGLVLGHVTGPESAVPTTMMRGALDLPHSQDGVYRHYHGLSAAHGRPSFAAQVFRSYGDPSAAVPRVDEYGVRFCGGVESLPHVSADLVLEGKVTASLVRDRVVLIGRPPQPTVPDLTTPTTDKHLMPALEFHGHALNTLLATRPLTTLSVKLQWPLYMVAAILFPGLGRRTRLNLALPLFLAAWIVQAIVVWMLFWRLQLWVPLGSLTLVEAAACLWSFDQRLRFSERAWQLLRRRGFVVSPRYRNPPSLLDGQPPWPFITSMLQQLFPLDNVALLRTEPGRRRLESCACRGEIRIGVLDEQRDLNKAPFADALRRRVAVRIDCEQPYFDDDDQLRQYFVPLFHAGQLQGVMIVGLSSVAQDKLPGLEKQLTEVAAEIATWLACYQRLSVSRSRSGQWWLRWAIPSEVATYEQLSFQLNVIERRLHQADQTLEHSHFGKAVFDLSGTVVTMNATMFRLLRACHFTANEAQVLQVVRSLSKRDTSECRELIRRVVVNQQCERIAVTDPNGKNPMLMIIQPVLRPEQLAHDPAVMQAFAVQGIDIELLPEELIGDIHDVREHVAEQSLAAAHESLCSVSGLSLELKRAAPEAWKQIQATIDRARYTVQRCQTILANGQSEDIGVLLPIEISTIVRASLAETRAAAEQRGISVSASIPDDLADISANPQRLRQIIVSCILVMIENARECAVINVTAKAQLDHLIVTIENEGCGVALDRIVQHHATQSNQPPSDLSRLLTLRQWLLSWGGDLCVDTELGEGASIRLRVQYFAWSDLCEATEPSEMIGSHHASIGR